MASVASTPPSRCEADFHNIIAIPVAVWVHDLPDKVQNARFLWKAGVDLHIPDIPESFTVYGPHIYLLHRSQALHRSIFHQSRLSLPNKKILVSIGKTVRQLFCVLALAVVFLQNDPGIAETVVVGAEVQLAAPDDLIRIHL